MEKLRFPGARCTCTKSGTLYNRSIPTTMPSIPARCDTARHTGCAVSGALSVTTAVEGAYSLVHGPDGCSHQFISLLHSLQMDQGFPGIPHVCSSRLSETDIIFGGIQALSRSLENIFMRNPSVVFIISSCIAETIGDDINEVIEENPPVPVIPVPIGGFIGGGFEAGVTEALIRLAHLAPDPDNYGGVAVIGEKNLEYEADMQYKELNRLLLLLEEPVAVRFVRSMPPGDLRRLGSARLAILRDSSVREVGEYLTRRFGTPVMPAFPTGLFGTLEFLREAGEVLGRDGERAAEKEQDRQQEMLRSFRSLKGTKGVIFSSTPAGRLFGRELSAAAGIEVSGTGPGLPVPEPLPAGTAGVRRVLAQWSRIL